MDDVKSVRYSLISINETESPIKEIGEMSNGSDNEFDPHNARYVNIVKGHTSPSEPVLKSRNSIGFVFFLRIRMSIASIASIESDATFLSTPLEYVSNRISSLTNECIDHFERNHSRNYQQALADKTVGVEFLYVAERITKALTRIFRIGYTPTISEFFYPIFFKKSVSTFYFHELFARAFWLLLKLKREMNVTTKEDYDVVSHIR